MKIREGAYDIDECDNQTCTAEEKLVENKIQWQLYIATIERVQTHD